MTVAFLLVNFVLRPLGLTNNPNWVFCCSLKEHCGASGFCGGGKLAQRSSQAASGLFHFETSFQFLDAVGERWLSFWCNLY
jgi:hypothetical protein